MSTTVLEHIRDIVRGQTAVESVQPEHRLVEDLNLDSVTQTALLVELENRLRVCLPQVVSDVRTVGELAAWVEQSLATEAPR